MEVINNLRTGVRLIGSFLVVSLLVAVAAVVGYTNGQTLSHSLADMYVNRVEPIEALGVANANMYRIRGEVYKYIMLPEDRATTTQSIAAAEQTMEESILAYAGGELGTEEQQLVGQLQTAFTQYTSLIAKNLEFVDAGETETTLAAIRDGGEIATARAALGSAMESLIALNSEHALEASVAGNATAASASRTVVAIGVAGVILALFLGVVISRTVTQPLAIVVSMTNALAIGDLLRDLPTATRDAVRSRRDEVGDVGRSLDSLVVQMQTLGEATARVAGGDLTVVVTPASQKDELGNALSNMVDSLRQAVSEVTQGANTAASATTQAAEASTQAGTATGQVAQTTEQVAKGANDTASAVAEANRGMEELSRAIDGIAKGAQEAAGAVGVMSSSASLVADEALQVQKGAELTRSEAEQGRAVAANGSQAVQDSINGMREVQRVVLAATTKVQEMGQRSQEVSRIVSTIEDIAGQTNLLALNAQIEAARAGEQGRGFAVVADEVRKLAERSARATQEIADLVTAVQQGASDAVEAISRGDREVETGVERAQRAGEVINELQQTTERIAGQVTEVSRTGATLVQASQRMMSEVERVSAVVEEVSASTEEMAASSAQVAESLSSVAAIAQEVGASAEEVSASTEEVAAQSEEVSALVQSATEQSANVLQAISYFKLGNEVVAAPRPTVATPAPRPPAARPVRAGAAARGNGNGHH
ncbi:MAG: methyl-accepting chemotaxis protein [Anaerolineae bacterium]